MNALTPLVRKTDPESPLILLCEEKGLMMNPYAAQCGPLHQVDVASSLAALPSSAIWHKQLTFLTCLSDTQYINNKDRNKNDDQVSGTLLVYVRMCQET